MVGATFACLFGQGSLIRIQDIIMGALSGWWADWRSPRSSMMHQHLQVTINRSQGQITVR